MHLPLTRFTAGATLKRAPTAIALCLTVLTLAACAGQEASNMDEAATPEEDAHFIGEHDLPLLGDSHTLPSLVDSRGVSALPVHASWPGLSPTPEPPRAREFWPMLLTQNELRLESGYPAAEVTALVSDEVGPNGLPSEQEQQIYTCTFVDETGPDPHWNAPCTASNEKDSVELGLHLHGSSGTYVIVQFEWFARKDAFSDDVQPVSISYAFRRSSDDL